MNDIKELDEGSVIGNYRVIRLLGQGGMGTVYEAEHELTGKSPNFVIYGKGK